MVGVKRWKIVGCTFMRSMGKTSLARCVYPAKKANPSKMQCTGLGPQKVTNQMSNAKGAAMSSTPRIKRKTKKIRSPLKTHGGKSYCEPWIISHLPEGFESLTFVEAFAGGANVLLNKPKSSHEVLNDIHQQTMMVWDVVRNHLDEFVSELKKIEYTQESFSYWKEMDAGSDLMKNATKEYVLRRMSRGGMKNAFAWSTRLRGDQPGDLNAWKTMLEALPLVSERIRDVELRNEDFREVLDRFDREDVVIYLDPPYLAPTRASGSRKVYDHEMSNADHIDLARLCLSSKAKILISGYQSQLYTELYGDWNSYRRDVANHSSQSNVKERKTEWLWTNF